MERKNSSQMVEKSSYDAQMRFQLGLPVLVLRELGMEWRMMWEYWERSLETRRRER